MNIEMTNIHKSFGTNRVLAGVDFDLREGEVHALMGENGAGKSTLMNILTGLHSRDEGKIVIDGKETYFANPKEAEERGVAFIHQELNIWPEMTVLDNLFIGKGDDIRPGFPQHEANEGACEGTVRQTGGDDTTYAGGGECSVGQRQMIEIAKALMTQAKVIIMDEPTAALTEREIEKLFDVIRSLKNKAYPSSTSPTGWRDLYDLRPDYGHAGW